MNKRIKALKVVYEKNKIQMIVLIAAVFLLAVFTVFGGNDAVEKEVSNSTQTVYSLEEELEEKLEEFLKTVQGVGKVKVCVTFDILEQTSFAQNTESETQEKGSETSVDYIIIENADGSECGLPISIKAPQIRGIAVACEGGGSPKIRSEITMLLTAALGISSNRVYVSQYKESN